MTPASKARSVQGAVLLLNQAFKDHIVDEERRFDAIGRNLDRLSGIEVALGKISANQDSMSKLFELTVNDFKNDVTKDIGRLETDMVEVKSRLSNIERWRWGLMGTVPILTLLGLWVLKHVFGVNF